MDAAPRIVVTVAAAELATDPELARRKNDRYLDAVRRAGGEPVALDETTPDALRTDALTQMDGLLLSGGADIDPDRYGQPSTGSVSVQPGRDELEWQAWSAARDRGVPVLGICRGLQAINVFSGGTLVQHLDGHASPEYGTGPATQHPVRLRPGSRLARVLRPVQPGGVVLTVNSYHHQAVRPADLAPGLIAAGTAHHPGGELVEAVESEDPRRFIFGVQCHPERTESTPPEFERLFAVFVDAARGSARGERVG